MQAAYIEAPGPADRIVVGERPAPEAGPGQVLVRVEAAAFNPIDLYIRSGMVAMPLPSPYIVGTDFAGTVVGLGDGAAKYRVGDRVWGSNQGLLGRQGTAGEFAAVDEALAYPNPDGQSAAEAAARALVGITAHLGLFAHGRLRAGESVFVPGGSGGVGSMVVQMAKAAGARVATSAGTPERVEWCRAMGADLALDYHDEELAAKLREFAPDGFHVWFETQRDPDLDVSVPLLARRGRMIVIAGRAARPALPLGPFYTRDCSLIGFAMFNAEADAQARAAEDINRWAAAGQLRPVLRRTYPLAQVAEVQAMMEGQVVPGLEPLAGKAVISIP